MIALALAAMLLAAPPAAAKADATAEPTRGFDRDCMDDYGRDLCDEAMRAKIREKFGAEPAEALAARGVEGVRVFMVNGYSQDMPMVAVLWTGEASGPIIETRQPGSEGAPILSAPARPWTAESARALMRLTQASQPRQSSGLAPAADPKTAPVSICLHAWVSITEAIEGGRVHRRVRNACGDDPIFDGGFQLSTEALRTYDRCNELDPNLYRNDNTRLVACSSIQGPHAYNAVQIHNRLNGRLFSRPSKPSLDDLAAMMAPGLTVQWPGGTTVRGPAEVAEAWLERVNGPARADLWIRSVKGSERVVTVTGLIAELRAGDARVAAEFTQTWTQDKGFAWRLTEWTIQPFSKSRQ